MGGKRRAWECAGYGWVLVAGIDGPRVLAADGERPVLLLPVGLTAWQSEACFGWAIADLLERDQGWLALLRLATALVELVPDD